MTMVCCVLPAGAGSTITFCCSLLFRLPDSCAFARRRCTASSTSFCCARKASPSFCVQSSLSFIGSRTCGKATSDFTLTSQGCVPDRLHRCIALDLRIGLDPARGVDDLQRIGRGHQHLREQRVRIERDRRDERLDLLGLEGRCRFLGARCGLCARRRGGLRESAFPPCGKPQG